MNYTCCPSCGTVLGSDDECPNCAVHPVSADQLNEILPEQECTFPKELVDHLQERDHAK